MSTYTFFVATEAYKFEATDSMLNIGEALIKKGHIIKGIFFFGSGVYNLKKDINCGTSMRNIPEKIKDFCAKNNIIVAGCSTWVSITGLQKSDFIDNAIIEGLGGLSEWVTESDKLLVFGAGG